MGELTPEDEAIWRRITRTVRPLDKGRSVPDEMAREPSRAKRVEPRREREPERGSDPGEKLSSAKGRKSAIVDAGGDRAVRRGKISAAAALDLHGMTRIEAHAALRGFLMNAQTQGARTVLVITGRGGAEGRGVLRAALVDWLRAPELSALVWGYARAHRRHGGDGAYYVFLRSARRRR